MSPDRRAMQKTSATCDVDIDTADAGVVASAAVKPSKGRSGRIRASDC
jgi:hypothetical protein